MALLTLLQNIVLCMTDDQGYADAGFQGHPVLQTPRLDEIAAAGMVLETFYAAAPVCSPTRASCLTGLHPDRLGITGANTGHLPADTIHLASWLGARGYTTGHFGKWHLGTLTRDQEDGNRGGRPKHDRHYAPPWERGFDVCFSTESKVPTAEPQWKPGTQEPYGTVFWTGPGEVATENLDGDDSRIIMDRALPFIEQAVAEGRPFFAVIWFHTPHLPLVTTKELEAPYLGQPSSKYLGAMAGIDREMGRLWDSLGRLGVREETLLGYCSDNGPERVKGDDDTAPAAAFAGHTLGSANPFRGRKRTLYEGGIRVPAFVAWPERVPAGRRVDAVAVTSDYFPTIIEALNAQTPEVDFDGVSLLPLITGKTWTRPRPVGFRSNRRYAWVDWPYKLVCNNGRDEQLFDLSADPGEEHNLIETQASLAARLRLASWAWRKDLRQPLRSSSGDQKSTFRSAE